MASDESRKAAREWLQGRKHPALACVADDIDSLASLIDHVRGQERARIVAWLRREGIVASAYADAIERGEHE